MTSKDLAVVLLSGGLDSCVTAALARQQYKLAVLHANYGQRTVHRELAAFRSLASFFQVKHRLEIDLGFLGLIGGSSLTDTHQPIPTPENTFDDEDADGIPSTYVPFRNTVILAAAVAWAEVLGARSIFIGANEIDSPGYPDCRPAYYQSFNQLIELGTRPQTHIVIHTPLIKLDKAGIVRLGTELQAPFALTWSCYQNETAACGRCSSCRLRLQGFAEAGITDPIPYK